MANQISGGPRLRHTRREVRDRYRELLEDNRLGSITNPIDDLTDVELEKAIHKLHQDWSLGSEELITEEDLLQGASLSRCEHLLNVGGRIPPQYEKMRKTLERQQKDSLFAWTMNPKDLLVTLSACFAASLAQGWIQACTGNLYWPDAFNAHNPWILGAVNAILWFSAATGGAMIADAIQNKFVGRRLSLVFAACFSIAGSIASSRTHTWQGMMVARVFLGIGVGGKSSIAPIYEAEVLPPSQRGRLLCSWQIFVSWGLFAGAIAQYIFSDWRNQVLSGGLPAFALLLLGLAASESPRWLVLQGKYDEALKVLIGFRGGEKVLAAKELCLIHYQTQVERILFSSNKRRIQTHDEDEDEDSFGNPFKDKFKPIGFREHIRNFFAFDRNWRAGKVAMIVMLSQQMSGVNIFAFLGSTFTVNAGVSPKGQDPKIFSEKIAIVFGATNALFSLIGYFLIEKKKGQRFRGRRFLLMTSLVGCMVILIVMGSCFYIPATKVNSRLVALIFLLIVFNLFYSPGAGCIPFLLSAEVPALETREISMSWAVFWNFFGSGLLSLLVPKGIEWSHSGLLYVFAGWSFIAFIMVWLFVPSTSKAVTLEQMSYIFGMPLTRHALLQIEKVVPPKLRLWGPADGEPEVEDDMELFSYQHAFTDTNPAVLEPGAGISNAPPPTDTSDGMQQAQTTVNLVTGTENPGNQTERSTQSSSPKTSQDIV